MSWKKMHARDVPRVSTPTLENPDEIDLTEVRNYLRSNNPGHRSLDLRNFGKWLYLSYPDPDDNSLQGKRKGSVFYRAASALLGPSHDRVSSAANLIQSWWTHNTHQLRTIYITYQSQVKKNLSSKAKTTGLMDFEEQYNVSYEELAYAIALASQGHQLDDQSFTRIIPEVCTKLNIENVPRVRRRLKHEWEANEGNIRVLVQNFMVSLSKVPATRSRRGSAAGLIGDPKQVTVRCHSQDSGISVDQDPPDIRITRNALRSVKEEFPQWRLLSPSPKSPKKQPSIETAFEDSSDSDGARRRILRHRIIALEQHLDADDHASRGNTSVIPTLSPRKSGRIHHNSEFDKTKDIPQETSSQCKPRSNLKESTPDPGGTKTPKPPENDHFLRSGSPIKGVGSLKRNFFPVPDKHALFPVKNSKECKIRLTRSPVSYPDVYDFQEVVDPSPRCLRSTVKDDKFCIENISKKISDTVVRCPQVKRPRGRPRIYPSPEVKQRANVTVMDVALNLTKVVEASLKPKVSSLPPSRKYKSSADPSSGESPGRPVAPNPQPPPANKYTSINQFKTNRSDFLASINISQLTSSMHSMLKAGESMDQSKEIRDRVFNQCATNLLGIKNTPYIYELSSILSEWWETNIRNLRSSFEQLKKPKTKPPKTQNYGPIDKVVNQLNWDRETKKILTRLLKTNRFDYKTQIQVESNKPEEITEEPINLVKRSEPPANFESTRPINLKTSKEPKIIDNCKRFALDKKEFLKSLDINYLAKLLTSKVPDVTELKSSKALKKHVFTWIAEQILGARADSPVSVLALTFSHWWSHNIRGFRDKCVAVAQSKRAPPDEDVGNPPPKKKQRKSPVSLIKDYSAKGCSDKLVKESLEQIAVFLHNSGHEHVSSELFNNKPTVKNIANKVFKGNITNLNNLTESIKTVCQSQITTLQNYQTALSSQLFYLWTRPNSSKSQTTINIISDNNVYGTFQPRLFRILNIDNNQQNQNTLKFIYTQNLFNVKFKSLKRLKIKRRSKSARYLVGLARLLASTLSPLCKLWTRRKLSRVKLNYKLLRFICARFNRSVRKCRVRKLIEFWKGKLLKALVLKYLKALSKMGQVTSLDSLSEDKSDAVDSPQVNEATTTDSKDESSTLNVDDNVQKPDKPQNDSEPENNVCTDKNGNLMDDVEQNEGPKDDACSPGLLASLQSDDKVEAAHSVRMVISSLKALVEMDQATSLNSPSEDKSDAVDSPQVNEATTTDPKDESTTLNVDDNVQKPDKPQNDSEPENNVCADQNGNLMNQVESNEGPKDDACTQTDPNRKQRCPSSVASRQSVDEVEAVLGVDIVPSSDQPEALITPSTPTLSDLSSCLGNFPLNEKDVEECIRLGRTNMTDILAYLNYSEEKENEDDPSFSELSAAMRLNEGGSLASWIVADDKTKTLEPNTGKKRCFELPDEIPLEQTTETTSEPPPSGPVVQNTSTNMTAFVFSELPSDHASSTDVESSDDDSETGGKNLKLMRKHKKKITFASIVRAFAYCFDRLGRKQVIDYTFNTIDSFHSLNILEKLGSRGSEKLLYALYNHWNSNRKQIRRLVQVRLNALEFRRRITYRKCVQLTPEEQQVNIEEYDIDPNSFMESLEIESLAKYMAEASSDHPSISVEAKANPLCLFDHVAMTFFGQNAYPDHLYSFSNELRQWYREDKKHLKTTFYRFCRALNQGQRKQRITARALAIAISITIESIDQAVFGEEDSPMYQKIFRILSTPNNNLQRKMVADIWETNAGNIREEVKVFLRERTATIEKYLAAFGSTKIELSSEIDTKEEDTKSTVDFNNLDDQKPSCIFTEEPVPLPLEEPTQESETTEHHPSKEPGPSILLEEPIQPPPQAAKNIPEELPGLDILLPVSTKPEKGLSPSQYSEPLKSIDQLLAQQSHPPPVFPIEQNISAPTNVNLQPKIANSTLAVVSAPDTATPVAGIPITVTPLSTQEPLQLTPVTTFQSVRIVSPRQLADTVKVVSVPELSFRSTTSLVTPEDPILKYRPPCYPVRTASASCQTMSVPECSVPLRNLPYGTGRLPLSTTVVKKISQPSQTTPVTPISLTKIMPSSVVNSMNSCKVSLRPATSREPMIISTVNTSRTSAMPVHVISHAAKEAIMAPALPTGCSRKRPSPRPRRAPARKRGNKDNKDGCVMKKDSIHPELSSSLLGCEGAFDYDNSNPVIVRVDANLNSTAMESVEDLMMRPSLVDMTGKGDILSLAMDGADIQSKEGSGEELGEGHESWDATPSPLTKASHPAHVIYCYLDGKILPVVLPMGWQPILDQGPCPKGPQEIVLRYEKQPSPVTSGPESGPSSSPGPASPDIDLQVVPGPSPPSPKPPKSLDNGLVSCPKYYSNHHVKRRFVVGVYTRKNFPPGITPMPLILHSEQYSIINASKIMYGVSIDACIVGLLRDRSGPHILQLFVNESCRALSTLFPIDSFLLKIRLADYDYLLLPYYAHKSWCMLIVSVPKKEIHLFCPLYVEDPIDFNLFLEFLMRRNALCDDFIPTDGWNTRKHYHPLPIKACETGIYLLFFLERWLNNERLTMLTLEPNVYRVLLQMLCLRASEPMFTCCLICGQYDQFPAIEHVQCSACFRFIHPKCYFENTSVPLHRPWRLLCDLCYHFPSLT